MSCSDIKGFRELFLMTTILSRIKYLCFLSKAKKRRMTANKGMLKSEGFLGTFHFTVRLLSQFVHIQTENKTQVYVSFFSEDKKWHVFKFTFLNLNLD